MLTATAATLNLAISASGNGLGMRQVLELRTGGFNCSALQLEVCCLRSVWAQKLLLCGWLATIPKRFKRSRQGEGGMLTPCLCGWRIPLKELVMAGHMSSLP